MQSDADKRSKYSIYQRQIKAQMSVKLSAFFDKERFAIWQRYKYPNHQLDRPQIWFVLVSTLFDRARCGRRCTSQTHIVIHTLVTPA
jgi:hypothetical protein